MAHAKGTQLLVGLIVGVFAGLGVGIGCQSPTLGAIGSLPPVFKVGAVVGPPWGLPSDLDLNKRLVDCFKVKEIQGTWLLLEAIHIYPDEPTRPGRLAWVNPNTFGLRYGNFQFQPQVEGWATCPSPIPPVE